MESVDLAIVGAGPAGAAAALAARHTAPEARVLLLDRSDFPRDKACGDGIAGHAVEALAALGVRDVTAGYRALTGIRIRGPHGATAAGATSWPNWVIPRQVFDARLVAAAEAAGVPRRVHRVRRLVPVRDGVEIDGVLRAAVVVAADGVNSPTRRALGIARNPARHLAVAARGYVDVDPDDGEQLIELVPGADWPAYWWRFPVGDGTANIGFGVYREQLTGGARQLYGRLRVLSGHDEIRSLRAHHLALSTHRPAPGRGRVLLAGDAASLVNPLSGEGIFYAVLSGRLAAESALSPDGPGGALRRYATVLRGALARHFRVTGTVARVFASTTLVDAAVAAAGRTPQRVDELGELALGRGTVSAATLAGVVAALPNARRRARHRPS